MVVALDPSESVVVIVTKVPGAVVVVVKLDSSEFVVAIMTGM